MTDLPALPPTDPLWQSEPLPDPVLQPPAPMPWAEPWLAPSPPPPPPPEPERPAPRPQSRRRPGRPAPSSTSSPVEWRSPPRRPPSKRSSGKWIGGVFALLFLLPCAGVVTRFVGDLFDAGSPPSAAPQLTTPPAQPEPWPTPALTAATSIVDAGPAASGLPVGTGVRVVGDGQEWTVSVLGADWRLPCDDRVGDGWVVVVTIRAESLAGTLRLRPDADFRFASGTGTPTGPISTTCGNPGLADATLTVGDAVTGQLAFVPRTGAGGEVVLGLEESSVSWTVPART